MRAYRAAVATFAAHSHGASPTDRSAVGLLEQDPLVSAGAERPKV